MATHKRNSKQQAAPRSLVTVHDFAWGSMFEGARDQLIDAGIPPETFPSRGKELKSYVTFPGERTSRDVTAVEEQPGIWCVSVQFLTPQETDPNPRIDAAIQALAKLFAEQCAIVRGMRPTPLSQLLEIEAQRISD